MKPFIAMRFVTRYVITAMLLAVFVYAVRLLSTDSKRSVQREGSVASSPTRVFLWAVPRSVSTTFLISISQSPDTLAWFEPFLFASRWERFKESGESQSMLWRIQMSFATMFISGGYDMRGTSSEWVKTQLEGYDKEKTNIFVKDMVKGITGKFQYIPKGYTHTFLIRHPLRVFSSYKQKHNTEGGMNKGLKLTEYSENWIPSGYFFKEMYDLVQHVRDVLKHKVIIIDSDDLLEDPEQMLKTYCQEIGLTYDDKMLHWDLNNNMWWDWMLPKDTAFKWLWRSKLYGSNPTHKTSFSKSGFGEKMELPDNVDDDVKELADASMVYYNELFQQRLRLDSGSIG